MTSAARSEGGNTLRFLWLYGLAWAGGTAAYAPFLTLLLPLRIRALAGPEAVSWLALTAFAGAVSASASNILFGWLSDLTRTRRSWVAAGLVLTSLLLVAMPLARNLPALMALIVAWQMALNMMLGPLGAWAGDAVPDNQKGLLGGIIAFSPAFAAAVGVLITMPGLAGPDARQALVAGIVCIAVLPVLLLGPSGGPNPDMVSDGKVHSSPPSPARRRVVERMWLARLLVQIAEAALFAYLLYWFTSIDPAMTDARTARILTFVQAGAVPLALAAGRWADLRNRPLVPLAVAAGSVCIGLLVMGGASTIGAAIAGYVLFGLATSIFLALHSGETLRVLPRADRRGRDLGLFNLTNTLPSMIMPWLTLAVVPAFGFPLLFAVLAGLAFVACLLLATIRIAD